MKLTEVYVGLGGNIGDAYTALLEALKLIENHPGVQNLQVSRFYRTSPVSPVPKNANSFINAVCRFQTSLEARALMKALQNIEIIVGKGPKIKNSSRVLDCDILFYGNNVISEPDLQIPHPRWRERLFVLAPLSDLANELYIPGTHDILNLKDELFKFRNVHNESVVPMSEAKNE